MKKFIGKNEENQCTLLIIPSSIFHSKENRIISKIKGILRENGLYQWLEKFKSRITEKNSEDQHATSIIQYSIL